MLAGVISKCVSCGQFGRCCFTVGGVGERGDESAMRTVSSTGKQLMPSVSMKS